MRIHRLTANAFQKLILLKCSGRRGLAIGMTAAMLHVAAMVPSASTSEVEKAIGRISITGRVTIDETPAVFGQTIFSNTRIVTNHQSKSTIHLSSQSRLDLHSESALLLGFSHSDISATLTNGKVSGFVPLGVSAVIQTSNASITTDACEPTVFSIHVLPDGANVTVEEGRVEVVSMNTRTSVKRGETFSTGTPQLLLTPAPPQTLDDNKLGWVIGGVGAAIAVVLVAILGRSPDDSDFGGCVIVPSGNNDPPPVCP